MLHEYIIQGKAFSLRPVAVDDAECIIKLRADPKLGKYLNTVSTNTSIQEKWIETYYNRKNDYYFAIIDHDLSVQGFISLYDIVGEAGEWGRWVIKQDSLAAIESALLIYCFAFEVLTLRRVYCRTIVDNHSVVSFHDACGLERMRILKKYASIKEKKFDAIEHELNIKKWPTVKALMEEKSRRVAQLIHKGTIL